MPNTQDENNPLNKATEIIIPELYKDGARPTVQEIGKFFARPFRAINALFSKADKWINRKECNKKETPTVPQELSSIQKDIQTIQYSIDRHFSYQQKNTYLRFFNKYKESFSKDDIDSLNKESSEFSPKYDNLLSKLQGLIESLEK